VIVRTVHAAWMPDPERLLEPKGSYARDHYRLLLRTLMLQASLALAAAGAWHMVLAKRQSGATIRPVSAWTQIFKRDRPKDHDAYVRVRLHDGVIYAGLVAHFSADLEVDGRELILAPTAGVEDRRQPHDGAAGEVPAGRDPGQHHRGHERRVSPQAPGQHLGSAR
jgi:Family of unknown function (DUF6338)